MKNLNKAFAILIVLILSIGTAGSNSGSDAFVAKHIAKAQFTTGVVKREPVNDITSIGNDRKYAFFFTDVRNCTGCKIEHQWWYKGKKITSLKTKAKYDRYRYWSKKTIRSKYLGDWIVKVLINGKVVHTRKINMYEASEKQKNEAPVLQRIQKHEISECEIQLRYYSDKLAEQPGDVYYKFMLNKWGKRCLPE